MDEISREDALAHFGVKGMKWGVRKNRDDGSPITPDANGRYSGKQIRTARRRAGKENRAINKQRVKTAFSTNSEKRAERRSELGKMKANRLKNPDQATALRLSRGEKALIAYGLVVQVGSAAVNKDARQLVTPALTTASLARNYQKRKELETYQRNS